MSNSAPDVVGAINPYLYFGHVLEFFVPTSSRGKNTPATGYRTSSGDA